MFGSCLAFRNSGFAKVIALAVILTVSLSASQAQPMEEWNVTFGSADKDYFYDIQQALDGYIIAGHSYSHEENYGWIVKTDFSGNEEWRKTFSDIVIQSLQQTSDGYVIAGFKYTPRKSTTHLIKTDFEGEEEWIKTFEDCKVCCIEQISDGYIIAGSKITVVDPVLLKTKSELLLIKVDPEGNVEWNRTFGEIVSTVSVQQTSDGYVIVTSITSFSGNPDILLLKTDSEGNEEWRKIFGGEKYDFAHSIIQTSDGGYIIACEKDAQFRIQGYPYLIKTDSKGGEEWSRRLTSQQGEANSVQETSDGYIVSGYKVSFPFGGGGFVGADGKTLGSEGGGWIIKTDFNGNEIWNVTFPGNNWIEKVLQTSDGGYIAAGTTWDYGAGNNDVWLVKLSPDVPLKESTSTPSETSETAVATSQQVSPATAGFEVFVAIAGLISAFIIRRRI